jgi:hypothetical protein
MLMDYATPLYLGEDWNSLYIGRSSFSRLNLKDALFSLWFNIWRDVPAGAYASLPFCC